MRAQSPITIAPPTTDEQIRELHLWAVRKGLRRAPAAPLFQDFCRRLVAFRIPLWRAFAGMRTLHPHGPDVPTLGGVTAMWCTRNGANAAKPMIGTCETALIGICALLPLGLTCRYVCGAG